MFHTFILFMFFVYGPVVHVSIQPHNQHRGAITWHR